MNPAYVVLIILAVIYIPIWVWVWRFPERAERYHLCKYGPCIMIKTQLGMGTMDRLSRHTGFWRAFGFASKVISAVLFLLMMYMLIVAVIAVPSKLASGSSIGIEYALAIPGFNPILPLSYGVVALVIAMVVHELGHGIQARANGARVDSSGLLYGVVPLGAFVEPNEEDMNSKSRRARMDMYTAGIAVNTVVAVAAILLLAGCCGAVTSEHGDDAGVYYIDGGSPALEAGIPASAIITGIVDADLAGGSWDEGDMELVTPTSASASGSQVSLESAGGYDPTHWYYVVYETAEGTRVTDEPIQLGAYVRAITVGSPAEEAGVGTGTFLYSVTVDGEEHVISGMAGFSETMSFTSPGQQVVLGFVEVAGYGGTATVTYSEPVTLADRGGVGFLGVSVSTSGMTFTTPDMMMDSATSRGLSTAPTRCRTTSSGGTTRRWATRSGSSRPCCTGSSGWTYSWRYPTPCRPTRSTEDSYLPAVSTGSARGSA